MHAAYANATPNRRRLRLSLLALAAALGLGEPSRAAERYYLLLFASQSAPWQKPSAHTFATFVKVTDLDAASVALEPVTLSWFPLTDRVRFLCDEEKGCNRDLLASCERARRKGIRLYRWGPYRIEPELYFRALCQRDRLESGRYQWKALDRRTRPQQRALNCVHAVSDVDTDFGRLCTGFATGRWAAKRLVKHFSRWILGECAEDQWLCDALGLGAFAITACELPR